MQNAPNIAVLDEFRKWIQSRPRSGQKPTQSLPTVLKKNETIQMAEQQPLSRLGLSRTMAC